MNLARHLPAVLLALHCLGSISAPVRRLAAADVDPTVLDAEARRIAAIEQASAAVVAVFSPRGEEGGSGVLISADGFALSNFHVTQAAGPAMKCGLPDGRVYDAVIVGLDPTGDVALIKLLGRSDFPAARWGDSDQLSPGDNVFAMGNPFMLAADFQPTVTYGIVSGVHRYQYPANTILEYADCIQIDASINPGNSGGPLFNEAGELVGINGRGSFEKRGRVNVGVAYAISINQIKNFLGALRAGRMVDHASLGAIVTSDQEGRVVIEEVAEGSDAALRGLERGDELRILHGRPVGSVNTFKNLLGTLPEHWRVRVGIRRGDQELEVPVRLRPDHRAGELEQLVRGVQEPEVPRAPDAPEDEPTPPSPAPDVPLLPAREGPAAHDIPSAVAPYFAPREGFVNDYFQRQELDRICSAVQIRAPFQASDGVWRIEGRIADRDAAVIELSADWARMHLPAGRFAAERDQLLLSADPPGSHGLLAALWLWRRAVVERLMSFDNVQYLGTAPQIDSAQLLDVCEVHETTSRSRLGYDSATGDLVEWEFFNDAEQDPCEIRFSEFTPWEGRYLPQQLTIRVGDQTYGSLTVQRYQFPSERATESSP